MKAKAKIPSGLPDNPVLALRARELLAQSDSLIKQKNIPDAVRTSLELVKIAPDLPEAHRLMGSLAMKTGAIEIAVGSLGRALALRPGSEDLHLELGQALLAADKPQDAAAILEKGYGLNTKNGKILRELAQAQLANGEATAALKSFSRVQKLLPDDHYARHMVGALSHPGATSNDYVADLFDNYAGHFEAHLTGKLGYRVPEALAEMVGRNAFKPTNAIDVGCGTGLVGAALAGQVQNIDGIDLAPRMIEKTRERGIYRNLATGDATDILQSDPLFAGPYDLAIAADVFIYVGAIEALLTTMTARLATGGLIAFSIETSADKDIEIRSSGRFAHSEAYITRLATERGLTIADRADHVIRLEDARPIAGALYLLARD